MPGPSATANYTNIDSLLRETQSAFQEFGNAATQKDAVAMDELVLVWLEMARGRLATSDSGATAREARQLKLKFMRARFLVRDCDSFRKMSPEGRKRIAECLFEVPPVCAGMT